MRAAHSWLFECHLSHRSEQRSYGGVLQALWETRTRNACLQLEIVRNLKDRKGGALKP